MERFARLESPLSPLRGQLPQRGRRVGASDPLPPPLGEVAERSEAGGGLPIRRRQPTPHLHSQRSTLNLRNIIMVNHCRKMKEPALAGSFILFD